MKKYFDQIYNEGLANTFFLPIVNFYKKIFKNKKALGFAVAITKALYTILILLAVVAILYWKWPL